MGFITDIIGGLFGSSSDAAEDAAKLQVANQQKALKAARLAESTARADFQPYNQSGLSALPNLTGLTTSPQFQYDYIKNNPFYKLMADDAQNRIFSNAASKGKLGSGGTAEALQNSLLMLGQNLIQKDIGNLSNLAGMGMNAAEGRANTSISTAQKLGDIYTNVGNAQANGMVGSQNAGRSGLTDLLGAGGMAAGLWALSDVRTKNSMMKVGKLQSGLDLYTYKFNGSDKYHVGVMAQDVEKIMPNAVKEVHGLKHINTEMVYGSRG